MSNWAIDANEYHGLAQIHMQGNKLENIRRA